MIFDKLKNSLAGKPKPRKITVVPDDESGNTQKLVQVDQSGPSVKNPFKKRKMRGI